MKVEIKSYKTPKGFKGGILIEKSIGTSWIADRYGRIKSFSTEKAAITAAKKLVGKIRKEGLYL